MSKAAAKTILPSLQDRQRKVMASLGFYSVMKERYDIQVAAAVAGGADRASYDATQSLDLSSRR